MPQLRQVVAAAKCSCCAAVRCMHAKSELVQGRHASPPASALCCGYPQRLLAAIPCRQQGEQGVQAVADARAPRKADSCVACHRHSADPSRCVRSSLQRRAVAGAEDTQWQQLLMLGSQLPHHAWAGLVMVPDAALPACIRWCHCRCLACIPEGSACFACLLPQLNKNASVNVDGCIACTAQKGSALLAGTSGRDG